MNPLISLKPRLWLALFFSLTISAVSIADTAIIATASNFKQTMTLLIDHFESVYPHQLQQVNASSGVLFNQIRHGAPFDALLAADSRYPEQLEKIAAGVNNSRFTYANGQLVLVFAQHQQPLSLTEDSVLEQLQANLNNNHKVAIANPVTAPYGIATQQVLEHLKLWQHYQQQWVRGANIAQSYQFIESGNASMGFAARAQLINSTLAYWPIPEHWHQPIRQQAILLQFGQQNKAAIAFLKFLQSAPAKNIIRNQGYSLPSQ